MCNEPAYSAEHDFFIAASPAPKPAPSEIAIMRTSRLTSDQKMRIGRPHMVRFLCEDTPDLMLPDDSDHCFPIKR